MSDDLKENVMDTNIWLRLVFMLLFGVIFGATRLILVTVVAIQFLWVLFSGKRNQQLLSFANQLATFIYQIYRYLSFNTETRPFPFGEFPSDEPLIDDIAEEITTDEHEEAAAEVVSEEPATEATAEEAAPEAEKKPAKRKTQRKAAAKEPADATGSEATAESEKPEE